MQPQDPRHRVKGRRRVRADDLAFGADARGTQPRLESLVMVLERQVHPPAKLHQLVVGRATLAQHGHRCRREQLRALALGGGRRLPLGLGRRLPLGLGHPLRTN